MHPMIDPNHLDQSRRVYDDHGQPVGPPPKNNEEMIGTLIIYLFGELGPLARHLRAGGLMAALTIVVGMATDIMANPELYAAVIMIASLVAGIIGQTVQATSLSDRAKKESIRIYGE